MSRSSRSVLPLLAAAACLIPALARSAESQTPGSQPGRTLMTMYTLLAGSPDAARAPSTSDLIVPGTVVLSEPEIVRYSEDLTRLKARLMESYRLGSLDSVAATGLTLAVGQEQSMPTGPGSHLGVLVTLLAVSDDAATYRVKLVDQGKILAEPTVSVRFGGRAIVGTTNGPAAPYAFVLLAIPSAGSARHYGMRPGAPTARGVKPPTLVERVPPVYPKVALAARVQGVVILECTVGTDGLPHQIRILRSIPLLDQAAIDALTQYRFEPGRDASGAPIDAKVVISIAFEL